VITMMLPISGIYGARVRVESGIPTVGSPRHAQVWQKRPAGTALGAFVIKGVSVTDNSTGVSEVECRPT
jgi:hypothetical protein